LWLRQRDRSVVSFNGGGNVSLSLQVWDALRNVDFRTPKSSDFIQRHTSSRKVSTQMRPLNAALDLAIKLKNSILEAIYHRLNGYMTGFYRNSSKQLLNHFLQGNKKTMGTSLNKTRKISNQKGQLLCALILPLPNVWPPKVSRPLATTHYTVKSIHATTVGVEPISDCYEEGGYKQTPSTEAYLESFKSVGSKTLSELISKFKDSDSPVNCIVYDSLLPWALDVARQFGIYGAVFLTNSASVCSIVARLNLPVKQETGPVLLPGLPSLGLSYLPSFLAQPSSNWAFLAVIMENFGCLDKNDWVFCNKLVKAMLVLWPLVMVGPMVPSAYLDQPINGDIAYGAILRELSSDQASEGHVGTLALGDGWSNGAISLSRPADQWRHSLWSHSSGA
ncbi:udp-glycosyltransferase 74f1, partial [Quercus suber]